MATVMVKNTVMAKATAMGMVMVMAMDLRVNKKTNKILSAGCYQPADKYDCINRCNDLSN